MLFFIVECHGHILLDSGFGPVMQVVICTVLGTSTF